MRIAATARVTIAPQTHEPASIGMTAPRRFTSDVAGSVEAEEFSMGMLAAGSSSAYGRSTTCPMSERLTSTSSGHGSQLGRGTDQRGGVTNLRSTRSQKQ